MTDLRALVASPHWYWMAGMAWLEIRGKGWVLAAGRVRHPGEQPILAEPDLTDPATVGCLLALVREAHHTLASTDYVGDGDPARPWRFLGYRGATEADTLAAALLGAP